MLRGQAQQRQRQPNLIIQVALAPQGLVALRQHIGDDFFGRRLANAAGDPHCDGRDLRPPIGRHLLERCQAIRYDEREGESGGAVECNVACSRLHPGPRRILIDGVGFGDGHHGSVGERIRDVEIAIGTFAAQRDEEAPGLRRPRVNPRGGEGLFGQCSQWRRVGPD